MNTVEEIYALYVNDDQAHIIYVGRAVCRFKRLKQHLGESVKGTSKKCRGIRQLLEDGHKVNVLLLEVVDLSVGVSSAEQLWIDNIQGAGCDTLLNGKAGDVDRLMLVEDDGKPWVPWTEKEFEDIEWSKDHFACKTGEKGAAIRGISFYRKGQSQLRMVHVDGERKCHGFIWSSKIALVVDYMNKLHEQMISAKHK